MPIGKKYGKIKIMDNNNDNSLIAGYLQGDEKALGVLVAKYFRRLYSFLYILVNDQREAEDLTQETFIRVWRRLKKFDQEKNFRSWLYAIAKNCAIDYLRKKQPLLFSEIEQAGPDLLDSLADNSPLPNEKIDQLISQANLNKSLHKLPLGQRSVISLYYQGELNFREISDILGESINTVKSRHRRALTALKQSLNNSNI